MSPTKPSFWSRPRGPLLLGAAACAVCCSAPIAAIVIGAGAASAIAAIAEPLAGVLLATGALLGVGLYVRRRRARAAACTASAADPAVATCSTDGGCGCGPGARDGRTLYASPEPIAHAPIACTFDLSARGAVHEHIDGYRAVFTHLVSSERTARGFTWKFRRDPSVEAKLQQLAEREHGCCSFIKFDVSATRTELVWEARADAHAQTFLDELFLLPERLREEPRAEHVIGHLQRTSERAGLAFTAEPPR